MRTLPFLALLTILISCDSGTSLKEKELELKEKELQLKEKELTERERETTLLNKLTDTSNTSNSAPFSVSTADNSTKSKKFIYIVIKAKQPALLTVTNKQEYVKNPDGFSVPIGDKYSYETIMETNYYTSEVIEVNNFTVDEQYKLMDKFEFQIQEKLDEDDRQYRFDVDSKVFSNRQSYYEYKSDVADRKCYVFNSYKDASSDRKISKRF